MSRSLRSSREQLVEPAHALGGAAGDPVVADRGGELEPASPVGRRQALLQDRSDVVDLQLDPLEPLQRPVPRVGLRFETPRPVVLDVPLVEEVLLGGVPQLQAGVLAHGFVQPIARDPADVLLHHQRLVHQRRQHVQRLAGRSLPGRTDRLGIVNGEPAGEHAQASEEHLLRRRQQVVTPVDGRSERLLTRQRRATSSGQQREPVGQPIEDLLGGEDSGSNRGKLDRQRQAVETAAQLDDGRLIRAGQLERPRGGGRTLGEQQHRFVLPKLGERFASVGRRKPERRHGDDVLTRHLERLPGGGDHPHVGRSAKDLGHQAGGRIEHVLTVVEDQQQLAVAQVGQQDLQRLRRGLVPKVQGGDHRVDHQGGIADLGELDPPGPVREAASEVRRDPNGQARLADASGADQADQTRAGHRLTSLRQLPAASHEARRLGGKVADPTPGPGHDEPHASTAGNLDRLDYASNQQFGRCGRRGPGPSVVSMDEHTTTQRVEVTFVGNPPTRQIALASGVSDVQVDGHIVRCVIDGSFQPFLEAVRGYEVISLTSREVADR